MKKIFCCTSFVLSILSFCILLSEEKSTPEIPLQAPFHLMSLTERTKTGIEKLNASEQEALTKWWYQQKANPFKQNISRHVTITAIEQQGKCVVFDDGSRMIFTPSKQKKTVLWAIGDSIGIGDVGKKGAITLYHIPSGTRVKGKKDQSPVSP